MEFNIDDVLNSIFQDAKSELDNLFSEKEKTHSEYERTYSPAVAQEKWDGLQDHYRTCKESIVRSRIRKITAALQPIRDYLNASLSEFDPALVERVSGIAALSKTQTEFTAAARIAGNDYWGLISLAEKAPDEFARPDIEQYRFILDGLENRIERTLANYEGSGTFFDSAAQIANVDAQNMPMFIQQTIERINSICAAFFTTNMLSAGELLTPGEKERIAQIAEEEFSAPACAPEMIGNSILSYLELHPEDASMVFRSEYGPAARAYAEEYGDVRRIDKINRSIHNRVAQKSGKKDD